MERQEIERTDFPTTAQGYDPGEVGRHLRRVADAVAELREGRGSLAGAAAEQVRAIMEAAERSAGELTARAERDAAAVRAAAESDAAALIERVEEAVGTLLERADAVERDLGGLLEQLRSMVDRIVESLREGAGGLSAQLEDARAGLVTVSGPEEPPAEPAVAHAEPAEGEARPAPEPAVEAQETPAQAAFEAAPPAKPGEGHEGARLIALNMALDGTPREETARYLEENFELDDAEALLDEVYARAKASR